jgi:endoglucanase
MPPLSLVPESLREALGSILSRPTAPFREGHVIATISDLLDQAGVPYFEDPVGNVVVGVDSERRYRALVAERAEEPVRVFIAHMDHPGFHGSVWNDTGELEFRWHGGSPTQHLEGAEVWLAARDAFRARGTVVRAELAPSGRMIASGSILLDETARNDARRLFPDATALFGGFGFGEPLWQDGELIYTKAADDLVGCAAIVTLASELFKKKRGEKKIPFLGLLTRAEEVGWLGAIAHFELGWLGRARREILCVSLETSRALPGAEIGKGPIVRLGDRFTVFDAGRLRVFSELAEKTLPGKHQRRIMDGGSCEASAAAVYGFRPVGISVPLGNYHNQSFEGGPRSRGSLGPAPEFVHLGDVAGLHELCRALMKPKLPWASPWDSKKKELRKSLRNYRTLLRSEP